MLNQQNQVPTNWPFPTYNNQRTKESQELLDKKTHGKTKDDLSDMEEALF
jgi:hypothetical protein